MEAEPAFDVVVLGGTLGIFAATIIGFTAGVLRLSNNFLISRLVAVYVEFTRNVPVLLQIIFWWVILLALPKVRECHQASSILGLFAERVVPAAA